MHSVIPMLTHVTYMLDVGCKTCAAFFQRKWLEHFSASVKEMGKAYNIHSFLVGNSRCHMRCLLCIACGVHVVLGFSVQIMLCQDVAYLAAHINWVWQA